MCTQKSQLWWFRRRVRTPAESCPKDAIWVYEAGGPGRAGGMTQSLQIYTNLHPLCISGGQ